MRRVRIESLGVSSPGRRLFKLGSVQHAVAAGKQALAASHYLPQDVRVLINTGIHRDEHICEPAMACYIQHGLDINIEFQGRRTLAFDLMNGGVGMLNALHVLTAMMHAGEASVGMVVASEVNADATPDPAYPYPASGAAVLLDLAPRKGVGFGAVAVDTKEEFADLYTSVVTLKEKKGRILFKRKAELEEAWLSGAKVAVDQALEREGLKREEIDRVISAQISPKFLKHLPATIGLPADKVVDLSGELADTLSTSTFLAFERAQAKAPLGPGKKALLLAFGSGVTVGATTYRF
jgi:3-oxoacyl-[acyl-carrier-protein] synthase III